MTKDHALKVENITKRYKNGPLALDDVSLHIKKGEIFGLLGPNGAGKSTLINVISSIVKKDYGKVSVYGKNLDTDPTSVKYSIGLVPQEIAFDPFFTVEQSLKFQSGYFGIKDNSEYIEEVLHKLSLIDKRNTRTRFLSGGMKRRLLVAKALIHKPDLLILDEPTAGVDVELRHNLWDYVIDLNKKGMTILLTTHYIEEAQNLCERVAILHEGKIKAMDKTQKLIEQLSEEKVFTLKLKNKLKEIPEALRKFRSTLLKTADTIEISLEPDNVEELFAALQKAKLDVANFSLEEQKLEDVFLKLTYKQNV